MKYVVILLILAYPSIVYGYFEPLNNEEITLEVAFVIVTCMDWDLTRRFRAKGIKEMNPFLGPEPTPAQVDLGIGSAILAHVLITYFLPHEFRRVWQGLFIALELNAVSNSYKLSIEYNY